MTLHQLRVFMTDLNARGDLNSESFLLLLFTELMLGRHASGLGNLPAVWNAYRPLVRDLVSRVGFLHEKFAEVEKNSRRAAPFRRHETVELVREYVNCMEEISQLQDICEKNLDVVTRLAMDCGALNSPAAKSGGIRLGKDLMIQQAQLAVKVLREFNTQPPQVLEALRYSLQVVSPKNTMSSAFEGLNL